MTNITDTSAEKNGQNPQFQRFEDAVKAILKVSKEDVVKLENDERVAGKLRAKKTDDVRGAI